MAVDLVMRMDERDLAAEAEAGEDGTMPTWAVIARRVSQIYTEERGEWCGLPMPVPHVPLVVEDKHPHAALFDQLQDVLNETELDLMPVGGERGDFDDDWTIINEWRGRTTQGVTGTIFILRHRTTGQVRGGVVPDQWVRFHLLLEGTFAARRVWSLETEVAAVQRLRTVTSELQYASYLLTGQFLEISPRSKVAYLFRRLRPTIALSLGGTLSYRPLAALCLHPIGYYTDTWCGAMVPTDDVLAHLIMMRADEKMFWRRANQHNVFSPEGGL